MINTASNVYPQPDEMDSVATVLTSNQFARRWRSCHRSDEPPVGDDDERLWRKREAELLAQAHTLGGIKDLNFVITEPSYGASPLMHHRYHIPC
jgi:hypothetical protein